jgi:hypothetical protein
MLDALGVGEVLLGALEGAIDLSLDGLRRVGSRLGSADGALDLGEESPGGARVASL